MHSFELVRFCFSSLNLMCLTRYQLGNTISCYTTLTHTIWFFKSRNLDSNIAIINNYSYYL